MPARSKDVEAEDAYLNLLRAHEHLMAGAAALFRERGLTHAQYNVLRILRGAPGRAGSCQYIGERLVTRVPDVTRLLDRMEAADLVTRQRSAEDRRVVLVRPTRAGLRLCDDLDEPVRDLHRAQFAHLSARTLAGLNATLLELLGAPLP